MLEPGTTLQDRYQVESLLGEGGMSHVYLGRNLNLDKKVAIKVIKLLYEDPEEARQHADQLKVEASIMARLDHPNLVRVLDMFVHGSLPVLVMDLIAGETLEDAVAGLESPCTEQRALIWAGQILDALDYLHNQEPPIIVRDLKPGNVMVGDDGRLRLIDFGLAKQMDDAGAGTMAIVRGMGSEGYCPLEQYAQTSTDARSDLYAFGATLYFMLTGQAPPPASLRLADRQPIEDPRDCNESVTERTWQVLQKLLELKPAARPESATAARELLCTPHLNESTGPASGGRHCLGCGQPLRQLMRHGVELDQCGECGGIWLDRGELERLMEITLENEQSSRPRSLWAMLRELFDPDR